ncbi:hypothetical protein RRG08_011726 [Elysia crispata]|uniref:Uncharacterized protein n=1 Tax=Elysia crispata TaxID=231223 RepID=A0AAE1AEH0_9GAST|nr:hypothetical protein RRG08_011726 [Elysia crispata]
MGKPRMTDEGAVAARHKRNLAQGLHRYRTSVSHQFDSDQVSMDGLMHETGPDDVNIQVAPEIPRPDMAFKPR